MKYTIWPKKLAEKYAKLPEDQKTKLREATLEKFSIGKQTFYNWINGDSQPNKFIANEFKKLLTKYI